MAACDKPQRLAERGNPNSEPLSSAARQKALQRHEEPATDQKLPAQPYEKRQQRCADRRRPPACLRAEPGQQHEAEHREQYLRDYSDAEIDRHRSDTARWIYEPLL